MFVCLDCIQHFLRQKNQNQPQLQENNADPKANMLEVGDLQMPHMLIDQLDIFIDGEKIHGNDGTNLINNKFQKQNPYEDPNEMAQIITMKTDLNSNDCQWKHMGKAITDYIKTQPVMKQNPSSKPLSEFSIDEITEFAIYDATSRQSRRELLGKKTRKVYCGSPISVKVTFKNDLGMSLQL